jgi:hypothetical protein
MVSQSTCLIIFRKQNKTFRIRGALETDFPGNDFLGDDFDGEDFLAIMEAEAPIPFDLGVDFNPLLESGFGLVIFE